MRQAQAIHTNLDRIGAGVSFACAIHCLFLPVIITILPLLGLGFLKESLFEGIMVIFSVSLALMSLCWGTRIHGSKQTFLFVLAAVAFFAAGHLFHDVHWVFMGLGGFCLVSGHVLNRRLCSHCHSCAEH